MNSNVSIAIKKMIMSLSCVARFGNVEYFLRLLPLNERSGWEGR